MPQEYEYDVIVLNDGFPPEAQKINEKARKGWRLVTVVASKDKHDTHGITSPDTRRAYFERPVKIFAAQRE